MGRRTKNTAALKALYGRDLQNLRPLPGEVEIRPPKGTLPANRAGMRHGWHCQDGIQVPTSLTCNLCPLYHIKRRDRRHPLACPEGRKNQICPILTRLQQRWAEGLIREVYPIEGSS